MPVLVTLDNTIGAGFLGNAGACILFGISSVQGYIYYANYPRDWMFQKVSVGILLIFDTIHLAVTTHAMYHYLIQEFGRPTGLQVVVWSIKAQILMNVLIVLMVQSLYVLRIWKLGRNFSILWPIVVLGVLAAGYAVGILLVVHTFGMKTWASLEPMSWVVRATFASSTAIDFVLAGSMYYYLEKSKSSFAITNNRIVTIMQAVIITGAFTTSSSFASLVCYLTMPNNLVFLGVSFLVTKLYTNSYIALLNSRKAVKGAAAESSYSVGRFVNGTQRSTAHHIDPASMDHGEDKINDDSLQLSSTGYRSRLDEDLADSKVRPDTVTQSDLIGITVHRQEERKYDSIDGGWGRV